MEGNVIQNNSEIIINVHVSVKNVLYVKKLCECKKCHVCENDHVWNSAACNCENGASIMDDLAIICHEIKESCNEDADGDAENKSNDEAKSIDKTNFNERNATCKT